LKHTGSGELTQREINAFWPAEYQCYLLTIGSWGDRAGWTRFYNQTSRPGWNLVLHLNFSGAHNDDYYRLLKPREPHPFQCYAHPMAGDGYHTLAWARIDLDLDSGEALIEEIQSDWIRMAIEIWQDAAAYGHGANAGRRDASRYAQRLDCSVDALSKYLREILGPHIRLWDEAMLASAIWFLKEQIGIHTIYYHTYELGYRLKRISGSKPPRSLYTTLPEKFCFKKTHRVPAFLKKKNNRMQARLLERHSEFRFHILDFSESLC
jgi:hypothetical protein